MRQCIRCAPLSEANGCIRERKEGGPRGKHGFPRLIGTVGFEPTASASQRRRSDQAELRPVTGQCRRTSSAGSFEFVSEAPFPVARARRPQPRLGYLMAAVAAVLWGINGAVSKTILSTGLSSERLAQVRSLGAAVGLVAILAVTAPGRLRLTRRELPYVATFGICGLAFVQWFYFLAIHRLAIGVALLIEYLAPLLVALWARFAYHEHVRPRIWLALVLALMGLGLIVNVFGGGASLSTAGVMFALGGAFAYALYVLLAEHVVGGRDPVSLLAWGFLFASAFWAVLVPWWSFPVDRLTENTSLGGNLHAHHLPVWLLAGWMIAFGTIAPFFLLVSALRHLNATSVGIVAMLEPVVGALVGWAWLSEGLGQRSARRRDRRPGGHPPRTDGALIRRAVLVALEQQLQFGELLPPQVVPLAAFDARDQIADERREVDRVERLRDVVDTPEIDSARSVAQLCPRGQEDDRDLLGPIVVEQLRCDTPAVEPGHHHVEQDHVGTLVPRSREPGGPIGCFEHHHPLGFEIDPAEEPDRRFVVDHQHAGGHSARYPSLDKTHTACSLATGSSKANREPRPSSESTRIWPPISRTRPWAMKSPRPVPCPPPAL